VSADTIVPRPSDPQAFNRYAAVRNNPIVRSDPTGHADCDDRNNGCPKTSEQYYQQLNSYYPSRQFVPPLTDIINKKRTIHQKFTSKHPGMDYDEAPETDVFASGFGLVIVSDACSAQKCNNRAGKKDAAVNAGYGNVVIVEYPYNSLPSSVIEDLNLKKDESIYMLYAHLAKASTLQAGDIVQPETIIGQVGSTGNSTGPHLHLEVRIGRTGSLELGNMCGHRCRPDKSDPNPRFQSWYDQRNYRPINPKGVTYYFDVPMPLVFR
jgi:murein DD-endopeptidase MepM/ murein hydrolase activator NlpD